MSATKWSDEQLLAYLEEQLSSRDMASIEDELRESESLRLRLSALVRQKSHGSHSLGEIWREHRLSCPTREQLGKYLLGVMERSECDYTEFHLKTVGCRFCLANLDDLIREREASGNSDDRRRKFYDSSAGLLKPRNPN